MDMTGKTILITGGTSGIGRALAERFHALGNTVIVAGRRSDLLDEITAAHDSIYGVRLDVADAASVEAVAADLAAKHPSLNVLINNAGIAIDEDLIADPVDVATARAMIETNILGTLRVTAALLPLLRRQRVATIINTTSGLASVPRSKLPTYSATKAFLHSWTQSLRVQLAGTPVEVVELAPPYVATEFQPGQSHDPAAMPLDSFIDETMALLAAGNLTGGEVLVERVRPMRWAERDGGYAALFAQMNGEGAHG